MPNALIIAIGAGIACALVGISIASNPAGAALLALLLPLPLLIVGFGFGYIAAAIAVTVATLITAAVSSTELATSIVLTGLPTIVISYYALLHQETASEDGSGTASDWYSASNILALIAIVSGIITAFSIYLMGGVDKMGEAFAPLFDRVFEATGQARKDKLTPEQITEMRTYLTSGLPYAFGIASALNLAANVYLAGRITRASGWLTRPWPQLSKLSLAPVLSLGFIAALATTMLADKSIAVYAAGFAGAFFAAYTLVGLAVAHDISHVFQLRFLALSSLYVGLIYLNILFVPLLVILALADKTFHLRERFSARPPPNTPPPT